MFRFSNKLTKKEIEIILSEFFSSFNIDHPIEVLDNGKRKYQLNITPTFIADLHRANRKLLAGGYELQTDFTEGSETVTVYFESLSNIEPPYEQEI